MTITFDALAKEKKRSYGRMGVSDVAQSKPTCHIQTLLAREDEGERIKIDSMNVNSIADLDPYPLHSTLSLHIPRL